MKRAHVGVLAALPGEGGALADRRVRPGATVALGADATLVLCGIGAPRAGAAARSLLAAGAGALVSWGTAAGIAPGCEPGDVLVPCRVVASDGASLVPDPRWRAALVEASAGLAAGAGLLAESTSVLASCADKKALHAHTGALVADMESAAIGAAAAAAGVPWIAVRAVCDGPARVLPRCALGAVDAGGATRLGPLLAGLLEHPREFPALVRLAADFAAARRGLRDVARRAGPRLAAPF